MFPKAVVQEKKATLEGTFERYTNFQGKDMPLGEDI